MVHIGPRKSEGRKGKYENHRGKTKGNGKILKWHRIKGKKCFMISIWKAFNISFLLFTESLQCFHFAFDVFPFPASFARGARVGVWGAVAAWALTILFVTWHRHKEFKPIQNEVSFHKGFEATWLALKMTLLNPKNQNANQSAKNDALDWFHSFLLFISSFPTFERLPKSPLPMMDGAFSFRLISDATGTWKSAFTLRSPQKSDSQLIEIEREILCGEKSPETADGGRERKGKSQAGKCQ